MSVDPVGVLTPRENRIGGLIRFYGKFTLVIEQCQVKYATDCGLLTTFLPDLWRTSANLWGNDIQAPDNQGNNILDTPNVLVHTSCMENGLPKTLQDAIVFFSDDLICVEFVAALRWKGGEPVCPNCGGKEHSFLSTRRIWKCKACKKQFSVKYNTIFEDSPLGLDKWLTAIWMIANCKNGVSSYEIHRAIGITQKSAWFMLHRIRLAMQAGSIEKLSGEIECDETYVGGKSINMHAKKRKEIKMTRGYEHKTAVMGIVERKGRVRAKVIKKADTETLLGTIAENVEVGSIVYTDDAGGYRKMTEDYIHHVINHAHEYVRDHVHTNGIENFWSLLKRSIKGTYVSVAPEHLHAYVEEQSFRFNERKGKDLDRFLLMVESISGKRLTYAQLIGYETSH